MYLVLRNGRELEDNVLAGELAVDLGERVELVVDTSALLGVKEDLGDLGGVLLGADALANDLGGVDEITEDGIVDSGESARAGALLDNTAGAAGHGENAALGKEHNVAVRELLLELTGEANTQLELCARADILKN